MTANDLQTAVGTGAVGATILVRWSSALVPLGTYWEGQVIAKTDATAATPGHLRVDYGDFGKNIIFPPPAGSATVHAVRFTAVTDPYGEGYTKAMGGRVQAFDPWNVATWGLFIEAANEAARRHQQLMLLRELRTLLKVPTSGRLDKRSFDEHQVNNLLLILTSWVLSAQTVHALNTRRWDDETDLAVADSVLAALGVYHVKWNQGSVTEYHSHLEKDGGGLRGRISEAIRLALAKKGDAHRQADKALGLIA